MFPGTNSSWFAPDMDTMTALSPLVISPCHCFYKEQVAMDFKSAVVTRVPYVTLDRAAAVVNASPVLKPKSEGHNRDW